MKAAADVGPHAQDHRPGAESGFWRAMFHGAYRSAHVNRRAFNQQGQAAFKRHFHGEEEPAYIASRKAAPLKAMALLRLCKVV